MNIIALIPARSGSERVPHKNIKPLAGKPLMLYSIEAAKKSQIFSDIVMTSDDRDYVRMADDNGVWGVIRPFPISEKLSPDIDWVRHALDNYKVRYNKYPDAFAILRPTSPFRTAETIKRAYDLFQKSQPCDSIRAVERCKQHPCKMWMFEYDMTAEHNGDGRIIPQGFRYDYDLGHNLPYQGLPRVYIQNASLEIAWVKTVYKKGSVSGDVVIPFFTHELEGFDINTIQDFQLAEYLMQKNNEKN